jgi:Leucine rich repeat variant
VDQRKRSQSPTTVGRRWALRLAAVGAGLGAWLLTSAIGRSANSTAVLGFIELPVVMLFWAIPCAVMGFCAGYLVAARRLGGQLTSFPALLAAVVLLVVAAPSMTYVIGNRAVGWQVGHVASMDEKALEGVLASRLFGTNPFVLAAVAQNPHATATVLHQIAVRPDPRLHEKQWSLFDVMGSNSKGLAVMRLVARNPNVDSETLEILSHSNDSYVRSDVAMSPKLSEQTLWRLGQQSDQTMQWAIARNPKTEQSVLTQLCLNSDEYVRSNVAGNPSASPDILAHLASDPVFHVRRGVASNPNTPPEVRESLRHDPDPRVRAVFSTR